MKDARGPRDICEMLTPKTEPLSNTFSASIAPLKGPVWEGSTPFTPA